MLDSGVLDDSDSGRSIRDVSGRAVFVSLRGLAEAGRMLPQVPLPRGAHTESDLVHWAPRKEIEPCLHRAWDLQLAQSLGLPSSANSGRLAPETTLHLEVPRVRSLRTSFRAPQHSETERVNLL